MIEFIVHWMPVLDAAAKIVGIVAVVGLFLAFCQYRHSVRIAERNERRASVELATTESIKFGVTLVPECWALRTKIENSGCQFFRHFKFKHEGDNLIPDASEVTEEDYSRLNACNSETIRLLNSLEGFAIPFAVGVADDRVGFVECGRTFVSIFEAFFGLYARHKLKHYYPSTQLLYWKWKKQADADERRRMRLNAGREFFMLTEKLLRDESNSKLTGMMATLLRKIADRLTEGNGNGASEVKGEKMPPTDAK